jgi:hypothetical protein
VSRLIDVSVVSARFIDVSDRCIIEVSERCIIEVSDRFIIVVSERFIIVVSDRFIIVVSERVVSVLVVSVVSLRAPLNCCTLPVSARWLRICVTSESWRRCCSVLGGLLASEPPEEGECVCEPD